MKHSGPFTLNLLKVTIAALWLIGWLASSLQAREAKRAWSVSGTHGNVVAADCENCDEDIGVILECKGKGKPAEMSIMWAAVENIKGGIATEVVLDIDGERRTYPGVTVHMGLIGTLPKILISPNDQIMEQLMAGQTLRVLFAGTTTDISLKGSRQALTFFQTHCGWTG